MKKLKHKNVVELYHAFVEGTKLIMIMELARGGELMEFVGKRGNLTETEARLILIQIVNAMQYCHSYGVVHRDLKLENVLLADVEDLHIKVIDFGISGVCTTATQDATDEGTLTYSPPEAIRSAAASSPALDIWAIGCMFYAMLYGELPFNDSNEKKLEHKICQVPVSFPPKVPVTEMGKQVISRMLEKDPDNRITLLEFMDLPYYSINDDELAGHVSEVVEACEKIEAAEEVKRNEEQKLAQQFEASLHIPSAATSGSSVGRRNMPSPARAAKKKKGTKAAASPRGGAATTSTNASRTYKSKKTTK